MTHRSTGEGSALERFERQTAWPMLVLSLTIIPLLIIPLTMDRLSDAQRLAFDTADWTIWAAFAAEYGIRLYLAPHRAQFFRHNPLDLLVVILPFLRPLRVVRSARALRLLRLGRLGTVLARSVKAAKNVLTRHKLHYALLIAILAIGAGAAVAFAFERKAPGANITSFGDGLWWAVVTVATVGYGDRYPVTGAGRGIAVLLMIIGIGLFGLLAASLASFFIEEQELEKTEQTEPELIRKMTDLQEQLNKIERLIRESKEGEQ